MNVDSEVQFGTRSRQVGGVALADHMGISDDDFFHLVCHIDSALKLKIEKGEYVDLDKLLPKEKNDSMENKAGSGERMEWIHEQGATYLVPAKKHSRISSFRKWEQAFRIYATIYCGANPTHAREIWQYISVINTAASSFVWSNVYHYDVIFRQLMQFNPGCIWAVTYNHMWNLSMREPLPTKQQFRGGVNFGQGNSPNSSQNQNVYQPGRGFGRRKSDYCWNYNKGLKCKFGKNCKFIERCSYCDGGNHGVINCPKLQQKKEGGSNEYHRKKNGKSESKQSE